MDSLNLSDTEERVQGFQSRIRVDYAAKIQEVAKLTDEVAKLQTRLLDIEYENNVLRQQLVIAKNEILELKKGVIMETASEKDKSSHINTTSVSESLKTSLKRERSPSLEILTSMPKRSSKKSKGKEKVVHSTSVHSAEDCQIIGVKSQEKLANTNSDQRSNKISHEQMDIDRTSVPKSIADTYLQGVEALDIHPPPLDLRVPRQFLTVNYNAGTQHFLTFISKSKNPSGMFRRPMIFPSMVANPSMPNRPGASELIFAARYDILPDVSYTLFCRQSETEARWQYLGEYEGKWVGNLTPEDFRLLSPMIKRGWAERLLRQKRVATYLAMRARIGLRLASVIPMNNKEEEERVVLQEVKSLKKGLGRPLSESDVITAFSNGEEVIDIVLLKCVKYDHVFANDMETRFAKYNSVQENSGSDSEKEAESESTPLAIAPGSPTSISKEQNNVHALVKSCHATKPAAQRPAKEPDSDSESDSQSGSSESSDDSD